MIRIKENILKKWFYINNGFINNSNNNLKLFHKIIECENNFDRFFWNELDNFHNFVML